MTKKNDQTEEKIIKVEEALSRTERFIEQNQRILIYVVGGMVLVVLLFMGYRKFYLTPREAKAQSQMYMAEKYFEKDSLNKAINGDGNYPGLKKIVEDYSGTKSARLAHYYLGICYLKTGKYDDAIKHLNKFNLSDAMVAPMAKGAIGDAYVELKNLDKAIDYYLKAADISENNFTAPMFLMKAAIIYEEQKKFDKALEIYKKIKQEYHQSNEARDIAKNIAYAEGMMNNK